MLTSFLVKHSKFGLGLMAIREDEDAAEVMGHPAASRLIEALCAEGLVTLDDGWLRLP